jgi:hypothetical protein
MMVRRTLLIGALAALAACSPEVEDYGIVGPLAAEGPLGKEDSLSVSGLAVKTNTSETQVWTARNAWEDTTSTEAKAAGIAWPAGSGLSWDQKYERWIDSLARTPAAWYGETFTITTPQGKTLTAPKLECSEVPIFLRVTFASWYGLPFFMTSVDGAGKRVYFGHFGVRTVAGRYAQTPRFGVSYKDYSKLTAQQLATQGWPQDSVLRGRGLSGGDDTNDFLFEGARAGAYFDELFLNKRVGYFLLVVLDNIGSVNLADARNAYNVKAEALRVGDFLLERWQRVGIGHTLQLMHLSAIPASASHEAYLASGSMPRRQPMWHSPVASKGYFTSDYTGGEGNDGEGNPIVKLGGGLKRWRVTKNIGGVWTNSVMKADQASWISDTNYNALKARPAQFQTLLGEVPPEQKRTALLAMIEEARQHLRTYPASCSARESREKAFKELYALNADTFTTSKEETDRQYRKKEDYVFAELVYTKSKTCCWNKTTATMYDIIMATVASLEKGATSCTPPPVFKVTSGGYDPFTSYAATIGKASDWLGWSEDEPCAQRATLNDVEAAHGWTDYCTIFPPATPPSSSPSADAGLPRGADGGVP